MSILTFNVKHGLDLSDQFVKARKVAEYGVKHHCTSSAQVKHIGMKSILSNAVLRKYVRNKALKSVKNVVIPLNNQAFRYDGSEIYVPCLKASIPFVKNGVRVKHCELDSEFIHVCCEVPDAPLRDTDAFLGVDRNTTGHIAVCGNPDTGKVLKLGKECESIHKKYKNLRKHAQKEGAKKNRHKFRKARQLKHRESNIIKNINHQISRGIVDTAVKDNATIVLEDLKSIRDTSKSGRGFRYSLNSWSFYQLQRFIEYKAKLLGVPVAYVDPAYTSQRCSRCGEIGIRDGKTFKCPHCGHADHADANASFNIALRGRLTADRDAVKGSTDAPDGALV